MMYTLGKEVNYDKWFVEQEQLAKAKGGTVFETFDEAKDRAVNNNSKQDSREEYYAVYQVDATLDDCRYEGGLLSLRTHRAIIKKVFSQRG